MFQKRTINPSQRTPTSNSKSKTCSSSWFTKTEGVKIHFFKIPKKIHPINKSVDFEIFICKGVFQRTKRIKIIRINAKDYFHPIIPIKRTTIPKKIVYSASQSHEQDFSFFFEAKTDLLHEKSIFSFRSLFLSKIGVGSKWNSQRKTPWVHQKFQNYSIRTAKLKNLRIKRNRW